MFQGFLPVDKPLGMRSSDCVQRIKRALGRGTKIGHGGTLDSTASGVLVLLLGGATRLSSFVMMMPKVYRASVKLGSETSTCDGSGELTASGNADGVTEAGMDEVIPSFLGWSMQVPPEISAVHVKGRRAHEIFRSGGEIEIPPRPVFIESMRRVGNISPNGTVELLIRCGKGTYIRALARDMGRCLGCFAHIASLRREAVGPFTEARSLRISGDFTAGPDEIKAAVEPLDFMRGFLPGYTVDEQDERSLYEGREILLSGAVRETSGERCPDSVVLALGSSLVSVCGLRWGAGGVRMKPEINIAKNFAAPDAPAEVSP